MNNTWNKESAGKFTEYDQSESDILYPIFQDLLGDVNGKIVADYGCGEGKLIDLIGKKGAEVYGFDISSAMIEKARDRIGNHARVIESGKIQLDDNSLDSVVCSFVLMMCPKIEDLEIIFREVNRVLRSGGSWIYGITHPAFIDKNFATYRNVFPNGFNYFDEGKPYRFILRRRDGVEVSNDSFIDHNYSLSTYLNLLSQTGFSFECLREVRIGNDSFPAYMIVKGVKK